VAADSFGNLYIISAGAVYKETPSVNGYTQTLVAGNFVYPRFVRVDSLGNVYVLDENIVDGDMNGPATAYKETVSGATYTQSVIGDTGLPVSAFYVTPNGTVYFVGDNSPYTALFIATPSGGTYTINVVGLPTGDFVDAVAADDAGTIYYSRFRAASVYRLDPNGTTTVISYGYRFPSSLMVDASGNVYVTDTDFGLVSKLTPAKTGKHYIQTIIAAGTEDPDGIAMDGGGHLYINYSQGLFELQVKPASFGSANVCAAGHTTPAPCHQTLSLYYTMGNEEATSVRILNDDPASLDFQPQANDGNGERCPMAGFGNCTVDVTFAPLAAGLRKATVEFLDSSGNVLGTTPIYGVGLACSSGGTTPQINLCSGFGTASSSIKNNGSSILDYDQLQLTMGRGHEYSAAFFATKVNVQSFTTGFDFTLQTAIGEPGDCFTFTLQNCCLGGVGQSGGGLGYAGIPRSMALKFDLHSNAGEGTNSTGVFLNGAYPSVPSTGISGVTLGSGDPLHADITYDGSKLSLTLTDLLTSAIWSGSWPVNIPATVGGSTAWAGFTGGTGENGSTQSVTSWTYLSGSPGH
jgi:hypothetical protein